MFRNTELVQQMNKDEIQNGVQSGLDSIQDVKLYLTSTDKELLKLILSNASLSQAEMAKILTWKVSKVKYYINKLKRRGIVERVGSSQQGYWKVLIDKNVI